jgi:hypothetical protein
MAGTRLCMLRRVDDFLTVDEDTHATPRLCSSSEARQS